jgi:hypothetical protein
MSKDARSSDEQVFRRSGSAGANGTLLMLGGVGGLCFALVGFAIAIFGRVGTMALQAMTTIPALLSIGALTAGWAMVRSAQRVSVSQEGLEIETARGSRRLSWDEVGSSAVESGGMSHRRRLNITDRAGKSIAKLDESFERFDEIVALISRHVAAKGDGTSERILRKKARRQAILAFVVGLFMAVAAVFVAWTAHAEQRATRLLEEKGQAGQGEIVRRFTAPNGVTKRVEYRVVGTGGRSGTRNVEVEPEYWESLKRESSIPIIYLPDEPEISRLEEGEVVERDFTKTPTGAYGLAALGGALALFMLAVSPLMWHGYDLAFDKKARTWSLKRDGKAIWVSKGASK